MTAQIRAYCNQKGGVGKSTTTFQLARVAVLAGRRVLIVDRPAGEPHQQRDRRAGRGRSGRAR